MRASSARVMPCSVPFFTTLPSTMSSSDAFVFRITAPASRMFLFSASPAWSTASPPIPAAREAQVPPPYGTLSVSPVSTFTQLIYTPSAVAAICAMMVSVPCPCSVTPVAATIAPFASSLMVQPSCAAILAPHAVEHRARVGDLDERREPDAAVHALFPEIELVFAQLVVVHQREELLHALVVRQRLEAHARGRLARVGIVGNKVPPSHLRRIDAELRRRLVDHMLGDRDGDRVPHGAVLAHHVLVLEHHRAPGAVFLVLV